VVQRRRGSTHQRGRRGVCRLRAIGYDVAEIGEGERILPAAISEKFAVNADGELEPLMAGSTRAASSTVTHGGICEVKRYGFEIAG
jgi:hypothetical protein